MKINKRKYLKTHAIKNNILFSVFLLRHYLKNLENITHNY